MPNVGPDGTLVPTVEIRTMRVGVGKGHRLVHQVFIDGNDISADVFSADIHLDGRGGNVVRLDLAASVVAVESSSVELTDATKRGLAALGWRTDDQVRKALELINNDGSAEASNAILDAIHAAMARYMKTLPDNELAHGIALGALQAILDGLPKTLPAEKL